MMLLTGARVALNAREAVPRDVEIRDGRIAGLREPGSARGSPVLDLEGCLLLPGLINAHDHLEFNLFPRLGRGPYRDAGAWARDIYRPQSSPVREHLRVPKRARLTWGALKNLLSGVTTVCHHNPYEAGVFGRAFPVRVLREFGWAHSLEFSPDFARRCRRTPAGRPFILHLGEARGRAGAREIKRLDEADALDGRTVLVHAVSLGRQGRALAAPRGASIVWCPSSNLFVLGRTLPAAAFRAGMTVALGSDSALTACGDLLDELRLARRTGLAGDEELYAMVTSRAASVLRLNSGAGIVVVRGAADLLAIRDRGETPAAALAGTHGPELVMVGGRIELISGRLRRRAGLRGFHRLRVAGRPEVWVRADVPRLIEIAARELGELKLAGKRVAP